MHRVTRTVVALSIPWVALAAGVITDAGPAGANGPTLYCEHVTGSTSGTVALKSCHVPGSAGTGTVSGATFVGTSAGTIAWRKGRTSSSTSITVTTTEAPGGDRGFCARKGFGPLYYVTGTVTANTNPNVRVGDAVSASLCITSTGVVRQMHYGRFTF